MNCILKTQHCVVMMLTENILLDIELKIISIEQVIRVKKLVGLPPLALELLGRIS